jgi:hypothetical protein
MAHGTGLHLCVSLMKRSIRGWPDHAKNPKGCENPFKFAKNIFGKVVTG